MVFAFIESVHKLFLEQQSLCAKFLRCRNSKIVGDPSIFPQLTCLFMQQKILIQVASKKKAAQHGLLLRRNVDCVKLKVAHCLTLEAVHCLSLTMQCETVISRVLQALFQTILFLQLMLLQKALDHFFYTCWIQVLVVRIDFSSDICAKVLQRYVQFELVWLLSCNSRAKHLNQS